MAGKIKTRGNLGAIKYREGCIVLSFYRDEKEPNYAVAFKTPEEAQEKIATEDFYHKKKCDESTVDYAKLGKPVPEQFVYPAWTWRVATEDDINA